LLVAATPLFAHDIVIDAESGLRTFRDSDGLWNGYNVTDVATPGAFMRDPALVLDFYNQRRRDVAAAIPNAAHEGLASLEKHFKVTIVTQNIDDLHERAGSTNVLHLHGEIFKMHSLGSPQKPIEIRGDILPGHKGPDGMQYRPHIVWFEEPVTMIEPAAAIMTTADIFVLVGTSLQVYPAAGLIDFVPLDVPKYIIDKKIPVVSAYPNLVTIEKPATEGVGELLRLLDIL
jgi:NAD-dependent deacetylase